VLAVEPANADLHGKLAPLLAETGQHFDALESYRQMAQASLRQGNAERAVAIYREAARQLPRELEVWRAMADLQHAQGRTEEAIQTLVRGHREFRSHELRPRGIHLLRRAREIEAWHIDAIVPLSQLLAKTQQRYEALLLLRGLAGRCGGGELRRVRSALFRLESTPANAWNYLRALFAGGSRAGRDLSLARPSKSRS
jgi:tetratricopeptide (TPR) repeat protein